MKRLSVCVMVLFAMCLAVPAFADTKSQLAAEYLELSKAKESFDATIETYVEQIASQDKRVDKEKLREVFNSYMGWNTIKKPLLKIVADSFTVNELLAINRFYGTKEGKALANKSPALSAAVSDIIGENIKKMVPKQPVNNFYPDQRL